MTEDLIPQDSFWEHSSEAEEAKELPPDETHLINPPAGTCPTCGEPVERKPGARGRAPKYHPECRPSARKSDSTAARVVRVSKAEELMAVQIEQVLENLRAQIRKLVFLLSVVDPYDAFVLHLNTDDLIMNARALLMRFEWARKLAFGAATGGSVVGLVISIFSILLPIAAHHNLVPVKKIASFLINLPMTMYRLQQLGVDGNEAEVSQDLLGRIRARMDAQRTAAQRIKQETEAPVDASDSFTTAA